MCSSKKWLFLTGQQYLEEHAFAPLKSDRFQKSARLAPKVGMLSMWVISGARSDHSRFKYAPLGTPRACGMEAHIGNVAYKEVRKQQWKEKAQASQYYIRTH